jgi:amino acid adenylation domain-containing protein
MIIGIMGILKAGGAYVPLDPSYPPERLSFMLKDCSPVAILFEPATSTILTNVSHKTTLVDLTEDKPKWDKMPDNNLNRSETNICFKNLAYIIYTSGSTGQPKGVMVEHGNVIRLFSSTKHWFNFNEKDVWTLFHSFAFDFSVWEIWGALFYGGKLIVVPQVITRSPAQFYELLCKEKVTILNQTPSAFRNLIDVQSRVSKSHSLREIIFGGEMLEPAMLKPWYFLNEDCNTRLVNMFGITETTVHVTYRPLDVSDTLRQGSPIGIRIPDLQIYILDTNGLPVPIGVPGEMYVGGEGVARGYLNQPELTAERFLPNPFVAFKEGDSIPRMYKTGDLVRWLSDGSIEYLGRTDFQVKIRGFRIELGEIEARLAEFPRIRYVTVLAREDVPGDRRLVAYYTADEVLSVGEMRNHLSISLPEYMVPAAYIRLEAMPLTSNGKLDLNALPLPEGNAYLTRTYEPPQGEIEQKIAEIWAELLCLEKVGRHDNFFELGGHSLLAVQATTRIQKMYQIDITLNKIFEKPTVSSYCAVVVERCLDKCGLSDILENYKSELYKLSEEELLAMILETKGDLF